MGTRKTHKSRNNKDQLLSTGYHIKLQMSDQSTPLKIVIFGLGSIGKRQVHYLQDMYHYDIFSVRSGRGQERHNLSIKEFTSVDEALSIHPDIAFITNPTHLHIETAMRCAEENIALFIEKPLSHSTANLDHLVHIIQNKKIVSYVAYHLRFHPIIQFLKGYIEQEGLPRYFRCWCLSYLPEWRTTQDYRKSYSASSSKGGGVILDLSHEFDYLSYLFGSITSIHGWYGKVSQLEINSEDVADAQISFNLPVKGNLHLNYFSLTNERKIQLFYQDQVMVCDLLHNTIEWIYKNGKQKKKEFFTTLDDIYKKQLKYFIENYNKKNYQLMNNVPHAADLLKKIIFFKEQIPLDRLVEETL